jgi:hypothetical protein
LSAGHPGDADDYPSVNSARKKWAFDARCLTTEFTFIDHAPGKHTMSKYVIERTMPGAGALSPAELRVVSMVSNEALAALSPRVKWQQSYVTDDKIFCVYIADDREAIGEHADLAGLPVDAVHEVWPLEDGSFHDCPSNVVCGLSQRSIIAICASLW